MLIHDGAIAYSIQFFHRFDAAGTKERSSQNLDEQNDAKLRPDKMKGIKYRPMINLMIVEDNNVVRKGLMKFLSKQHGFCIVAEASDGTGALNQLQNDTGIDVVLADWNMPDMDGLELTTHIASLFPQVNVVILTMHGKQEYKEQAQSAGAKGYLLKHLDLDELVKGIHKVANGEKVVM